MRMRVRYKFAAIKHILTIFLLFFLALYAMAGKDDSVIVRHNMVYEKVRMALNDLDVFGNDR